MKLTNRIISPIAFLLFLPLAIFAQAPQETEEAADDEIYIEDNQREIDSIRALIAPSTPDNLLIEYYGGIAQFSHIADTVIKYANLSNNLCKESDIVWLAKNNFILAKAHHIDGDNKTALPYLEKAFVYFEKINDTENVIKSYQLQSYIYEEMNDLDSAVHYMTKVLEFGNRLNDTSLVASCYQDLGVMYGERQMNKESEKYLSKALELDSLTNNLSECALDLFYLAQLILHKETDSLQDIYTARNYITKSVKIFESLNSYKKYLAYSTSAAVYISLAHKTNIDKYADSSLYYYKMAEPTFKISSGPGNYRLLRLCYVDYLLYYKKYDDALRVMRELEDTFDDDTPQDQRIGFHLKYQEIYLSLGDYKNAYLHSEQRHKCEMASLNDSTLAALSDVKALQISIKDKLEREKDEEVHAADKRRLQTLIIALIAGLVLVFIIFWNKHNANRILSEKNLMLNSQKAEIEAQRDEIAVQKDIITRQCQDVENVNNQLFASLNYAERIQLAAVSKPEEVKALFPESFVFYKPRDIVSGDFYRCGRCGRYSVMVTADCTGHGIPGAFLSMLGLSALKEFAVTEYDAENPGTILDRIRDFIKTTLIAPQKDRTVNEGMDMTICCYDFDKMVMHYAIAQQLAVIVRKGEVIKLQGDSMPVGRYMTEKEHFRTMTTTIEKGDMVYSFSDGVHDQLGGKFNRKFLRKNLVSLLASFADKPAEEQCQILEEKIRSWQGETPQIDDMTMIGIRV